MLRNMMVACALLLAASVSASAQSQKIERIRIGGDVQLAQLITRPLPYYPQEAMKAGISGTVVLHAVIAQDGTVKQLDYVSGPQELVDSAMKAWRQARYRPTLLNGQPVEVDTTINVVYELNKSAETIQLNNGKTLQLEVTRNDQPATQQIDPQLKADIVELFQVMRLNDMVTRMLNAIVVPLRTTIMPSLPDTPNREVIAKEFVDRLVAIGNSPEFFDLMVPVYAKYLTDVQVKKALEFYKSDAGQQILAMQGNIYEELRPISTKFFTEKGMDIIRDLCSKYPELKGQNACASE